MLAEVGITLADFQAWKRWPVIYGVQIDYLKPTFMGDALEVQTRVTEHGRTHFSLEQEIRRDGGPVARARIRSVMINEKGRPAEFPEPVARIWTERLTGEKS
jgi:acyl-CoA thioesterase FadM